MMMILMVFFSFLNEYVEREEEILPIELRRIPTAGYHNSAVQSVTVNLLGNLRKNN